MATSSSKEELRLKINKNNESQLESLFKRIFPTVSQSELDALTRPERVARLVEHYAAEQETKNTVRPPSSAASTVDPMKMIAALMAQMAEDRRKRAAADERGPAIEERRRAVEERRRAVDKRRLAAQKQDQQERASADERRLAAKELDRKKRAIGEERRRAADEERRRAADEQDRRERDSAEESRLTADKQDRKEYASGEDHRRAADEQDRRNRASAEERRCAADERRFAAEELDRTERAAAEERRLAAEERRLAAEERRRAAEELYWSERAAAEERYRSERAAAEELYRSERAAAEKHRLAAEELLSILLIDLVTKDTAGDANGFNEIITSNAPSINFVTPFSVTNSTHLGNELVEHPARIQCSDNCENVLDTQTSVSADVATALLTDDVFDMVRLQLDDPNLNECFRDSEPEHSPLYIHTDNSLLHIHRIKGEPTFNLEQLVVPTSKRPRIVELAHDMAGNRRVTDYDMLHTQAVPHPAHSFEATKCQFDLPSSQFAAYQVRYGQQTVPKDNAAEIAKIAEQSTKRALRSFLGICNHYKKFVINYSEICYPLTKLRNNRYPVKFVFNDQQRSAFDQLKECWCSATILYAADPDKPFMIHCDASLYAIGA